MKKTYIAPEMEVFEQKITQPLMTTSLPVNSDIEITSDDMLAPGLNPGLPGIPGLNGLDNEIFGF